MNSHNRTPSNWDSSCQKRRGTFSWLQTSGLCLWVAKGQPVRPMALTKLAFPGIKRTNYSNTLCAKLGPMAYHSTEPTRVKKKRGRKVDRRPCGRVSALITKDNSLCPRRWERHRKGWKSNFPCIQICMEQVLMTLTSTWKHATLALAFPHSYFQQTFEGQAFVSRIQGPEDGLCAELTEQLRSLG